MLQLFLVTLKFYTYSNLSDGTWFFYSNFFTVHDVNRAQIKNKQFNEA